MKLPQHPRPMAVGSPTLSLRAYQRLHSIDELEDARLAHSEKLWEALEWMRMKGIEILGREGEQS